MYIKRDPVFNKITMINDDNTGTPYKKVRWFHWDETWSHEHGPYDTELEARRELENYIKHLEGGQ